MAHIQPLAAIRYTGRGTLPDISSRLSPPYDILTEQDKDRLLRIDPCNFVKIDLPHVPPSAAGAPAVYAAAAAEMQRWLAEGTLVRDEVPALYAYHQRFRFAEIEHVRKMFLTRLRLEPFGAGGVYPHEHTFGGPKEDRLALTKASRANLSPVFGLYEDASNSVAAVLEPAPAEPALLTGVLEEVENQIWAITQPERIGQATALMAERPIYVADGHHRYGTALLYRDWLAQQQGTLRPEHPANYVLCALCAMEDPGLLILPTHRVLVGLTVPRRLFASDARLEVVPLSQNDPNAVVRELETLGSQALALYSADEQQVLAIRPRHSDSLEEGGRQRSRAWRSLALAWLHAYLIDGLIVPRLCAGRAPEIRYVKSADAAVALADRTRGSAFLLQATKMEELRAVCQAGDLMPHKSTYFFPKLASGLVINPLSE